jgi:hypothetical protein
MIDRLRSRQYNLIFFPLIDRYPSTAAGRELRRDPPMFDWAASNFRVGFQTSNVSTASRPLFIFKTPKRAKLISLIGMAERRSTKRAGNPATSVDSEAAQSPLEMLASVSPFPNVPESNERQSTG